MYILKYICICDYNNNVYIKYLLMYYQTYYINKYISMHYHNIILKKLFSLINIFFQMFLLVFEAVM